MATCETGWLQRELRLTDVLSPDITEAIFRGEHHQSLTVAQLIANLEIDLDAAKITSDKRFLSGSVA